MTTKPTTEEREIERRAAAFQADAWLKMRPVYLDTETTGVGDGTHNTPLSEIVCIAVVDHDGTTLLHELVRPMKPIPADATRIHGITDADVAAAPTFDRLWPRLVRVLDGRNLVIYNSLFDRRMINQSMTACGVGAKYRACWAGVMCAMTLYAQYRGEWNEYRQDYHWQKLSAAAAQCGLQWRGEAHGALADADMTRQIIHHMAAQAVSND